MSSPSPIAARVFPLAEADLCVKCGLCLPHCPTYVETGHEGDSPRGRIALMQGLATGLVPVTANLQQHLDGCLSCRRCEVVCPAKVPYGRLIDAGRSLQRAADAGRVRGLRLLSAVLTNATARRVLRFLFRWYQLTGVQKLLRSYPLLGRGRWARLESLLPGKQARPFKVPSAHAETSDGPEIVLFQGCVTDVLERGAIDASHALLQAAGYRVRAISGQTCCGALLQHSGEAQGAQRLAARNCAAFAGIDKVATNASGCAATLKDYADWGGSEGRRLADKTRDVHEWLFERREHLRFRPLRLRAALHRPCTHRNVLRSDEIMAQLLRRIPELELIELDPAQHCCGAAGLHFVAEPVMADRLLQRKLDAACSSRPDLILSSNIGCSLHLSAGFRRAGLKAPAVRHPVEVLAQQLDPPPLRS